LSHEKWSVWWFQTSHCSATRAVMTHVAPPRWSESEFAAQIARATEIFKNKRIDEPSADLSAEYAED